MPAYHLDQASPILPPEDAYWIAPTATVIGSVELKSNASVWYGAVLRGDICTIVVREGANVQDNSVLHAAPGETLVIGRNATVGHGCIVHCADYRQNGRQL